MFSNVGTRLGKMLAEKIAERFKTSPAQGEAPTAEPATGSAEATPTEEVVPTEMTSATGTGTLAPEAPSAEQPAPSAAVPEPVSDSQPEGSPAQTPTPVDTAVAPVEATPVEVQPGAAAPAAPEKSTEELEEERLWSEVDRAWGAEDFGRVTELLDQLKVLQPEDAAEIDQKIAAAQYNAGSHFEQTGELARALYLYQEAQRRDPNLGEAGFAIERVQNQIAAAARPAPSEAPAEAPSPAPQTYTVEAGDSLWAIAERFYGDGSQWGKILEANRGQIENPDMIQPGQVLTIP
jgi:LysM repeat protein